MFTTMKIWRMNMNKNKIVEDMVAFIEEKEREYQASKLINDTKIQSDVVKSILERLEGEVNNENQQD